jgi:hypothetical protein
VAVEHRRGIGLDGAQKLQELTASMLAMRLADGLAGGLSHNCVDAFVVDGARRTRARRVQRMRTANAS